MGKSQSFVADLQRWLFQSNLMKCKMVYLLYPPMPNPWRWLEILDIVGSSIVFENYIQYQTLWRNVTFLGFDLSFFTTVYTIDMFLLRLFFSWVLHIRELFFLIQFSISRCFVCEISQETCKDVTHTRKCKGQNNLLQA